MYILSTAILANVNKIVMHYETVNPHAISLFLFKENYIRLCVFFETFTTKHDILCYH